MERVPEAELMNDELQARAYALADFSEPHERFVRLFHEAFPDWPGRGHVLDLGCGPADVSLRFAKAFPACCLDGMDGSEAMLAWGVAAIKQQNLQHRIHLRHGYLPGAEPPLAQYDAVISNSLLHHLRNPQSLWEVAIRFGKPGAPVFIMDLMRPETTDRLEALVEQYAATEPEVLRRDFYNSLRAAYRPEEVREQLDAVGLRHFRVRVVSDRHFIVAGKAR
jgi:ubiquinone/menaquinone biosynthesis C-methylase UbiE